MTETANSQNFQKNSTLSYPKTFVIGAAKSGTTSLCNWLRDHPQVFLPRNKEPAFFAWDERYQKGLEYYASLYQQAREHQILLDGSTPYSRCTVYPETVQRLFAAVPEAKFVYIMRHPVDRAFSHYCHRWLKEVRKGEPFTESFEDYVPTDPMCVDDSLYKLQVEQYLKYFPIERFRFFLTEDLRKKKVEILQEVCRHFEIDDSLENFNLEKPSSNVSSDFREILVKRKLRNLPLVKSILPLIPSGTKEWVYSNILRKTSVVENTVEAFKPIPMKPETRQELIEHYRETIEWVEDLMERKLPHWYE